VGTNSGLASYDPGSDEWVVYSTGNSGLPDNTVYSLLQSADGAIWVGTKAGGLARYYPAEDEWVVYSADTSGIPGDTVNALLQSEDGAIWVGTEKGGLSRMSFTISSPLDYAGSLVLVAGGGAAKANTLWPTTKNLAVSTYRSFVSRGFRNPDIYFIGPEKWVDFNGDGFNDHVVDRPSEDEDRNPTVADIHYAITDWAVDRHNPDTPLYVYLIDHGYPDDGEHGPYFVVAPGELLYAGMLNDLMDSYQQATDGRVVLVNESCYSGQFLPHLAAEGRIIITSTANKIANYSNRGVNSFTYFFLQKLFENDSLQQAFLKAIQRLGAYSLTSEQTPLMDDNGDGRSDRMDGLLASDIRLGGDHTMGAPWPEILTVARSNLSGSVGSFTATTNAHMKGVWAAVTPPDYIPDSSGDYQKIELDTFDLNDDDENLTYEGKYQGFDSTGTYRLVFYAKDQFGNVAVSDAIAVPVTRSGEGSLSGRLIFTVDGHTVLFDDTDVRVAIVGTGKSAMADADGRFVLNGVPQGRYRLEVGTGDLDPITVPDVDIVSGQATDLDVLNVPLSVSDCSEGCDQNGDGVIGLEEAIHALQVVSGVRVSK